MSPFSLPLGLSSDYLSVHPTVSLLFIQVYSYSCQSLVTVLSRLHLLYHCATDADWLTVDLGICVIWLSSVVLCLCGYVFGGCLLTFSLPYICTLFTGKSGSPFAKQVNIISNNDREGYRLYQLIVLQIFIE